MTISASGRNNTTEERRKAILQAALRSFLTKGFTNTTVEEIRQLSGASTGSIYHHFENKEKIAIELYREGRNDLNLTLAQSFACTDPAEGVKSLVHNYLDWFERSPDLGLYVIQAANTEYLGRHVEEIRLSLDTFPQRFFAWLAPFIAAGTIAVYPQHLYPPLTLGASRDFIRRWLRNRLPEQLSEAREPLAQAAWLVLSAQH